MYIIYNLTNVYSCPKGTLCILDHCCVADTRDPSLPKNSFSEKESNFVPPLLQGGRGMGLHFSVLVTELQKRQKCWNFIMIP